MQMSNAPRNANQVAFAAPLLSSPEIIAALRRETVLNNARQRRKRSRPGICVLMLRDLRKFLCDRYDKFGPAMPEGCEAALDDFVILLNYVAMLGDYRALRAAKARWMPWLGEAAFDAMVAQVVHSPLYLSPDALGERIGLYDATRTRLKIKTIGAVDCNKAQRIERRHGKKLAKRKANRAARRALRPVSASKAKVWIALGMSRSSWYANGKPQLLDAGQNMAPNKLSLSAGCQVLSKQPTGASAQADLTRSDSADVDVLVAELSTADALGLVPALAADIAAASKSKTVLVVKRETPVGARLCLNWPKNSKNPFNNYRLPALASEMGLAAA